MDQQYRERLRTDAQAGNRIAERLLLLELLRNQDLQEIEDYVGHCEDTNHGRYLEAELCCFHGWPGEKPWQDLLRQSAEAGHSEARTVVSVYHDWARSAGILTPDRLADDCSADGWNEWLAPGWDEVFSGEGVTIERSAEFLPRRVIAYLRSLLGRQLRPSAVIDPDSGQAIAHPVRINQMAQWLPEQLGWVGKLFEVRLAAAGGYPISCGEVPSLLHYGPGQRYKAHFDCISGKQAKSAEGLAQGGQRTLTLLLSLGDDEYTGGETFFPHLKAGARADVGELLRFNNTDENGKPLRSSLHEGRPVKSGQKWLLSKWVREQTTPYGREIGIVQR